MPKTLREEFATSPIADHTSVDDCRCQDMSAILKQDLDVSIGGSIIASFEMEHWDVDDIRGFFSYTVDRDQIFARAWQDSWGYVGNVMNCVLEQNIHALPSDERSRLQEGLEIGRTEP